jgi:hypothetical protein
MERALKTYESSVFSLKIFSMLKKSSTASKNDFKV